METQHITLFVDLGYLWLVKKLYESSHERSSLRMFMDSYSFRDYVIRTTIKHKSFADVIAITDRSYTTSTQCAKDCRWNLVEKFFDNECRQTFNNMKMEKIVLETLGLCDSDRFLHYSDIACKRIKTFSHPYFTEFLFDISKKSIEISFKGNVDEDEFSQRLLRVDDICTLSYLSCNYEPLVHKVLNRASFILNLETSDGRKLFNRAFPKHKDKMSYYTDLSPYVNYLSSSNSYKEFRERQLHVETVDGVVINNLSLKDREKMWNLQKGHHSWHRIVGIGK